MKDSVENKYLPRECERCGEYLYCTANSDCFCVDIKLSKMALDYVKNNFEDCLCEKCLKEIAKEFPE